MAEKKPLEIRDNKIPARIYWDEVSSVHVWGWLNPESEKFVIEALFKHKKDISWKDDEALQSREKLSSVDEH